MYTRMNVALWLGILGASCASPLPGWDRAPGTSQHKPQDASVSTSGPAWQQLEAGGGSELTAVQFLDASEGWVAGLDATLKHTLNGGKNWTVVPPLGISPSSGFGAVHVIDSQTGWAAGSGIVVRTLDGGASWRGWDNSDHRGGSPTFYGLFALSNTTAWIVGGVQQGNLPSCQSGDASCPTLWYEQLPLASGQARHTQQHTIDRPNILRDVFFASPASGYAVGSSGFVLRVDNASTGMDLALDTQVVATTADLNAVFMLDEQTAWIVGDGGVILHTQNGKNWSLQSSGTDADLRDVYFVDGGRGWVAGVQGTILGTTNGGDDWVEMATGVTVSLNALSFPSSALGFAVGEEGTILKWQDTLGARP